SNVKLKRVAKRLRTAVEQWPLNNNVRRLSSIVPVPSLRGESESAGKQRQAKACRKTAEDSR
ncbi:MAG: hypothetical protein ACK5GJ_19955, partial [Planctomycetota bacterium]